MTLVRMGCIGLLAIIAVGGVGAYVLTPTPDVQPDFVALEGSGMSTLHWLGGKQYANIVGGRQVMQLELTQVEHSQKLADTYHFKVLSAEPGMEANFSFQIGPVLKILAAASTTGNITSCDLCGPNTARQPLSKDYRVVWPLTKS